APASSLSRPGPACCRASRGSSRSPRCSNCVTSASTSGWRARSRTSPTGRCGCGTGPACTRGTVVWVAGVTGADLGTGAGLERGRQGRFRVLPTLQLEAHPEVFAAGDIALAQDGAGNDLPMMAPVAIQEGRHAAVNILAAAESRPLKPFRYRDRGVMATIGRQRAVAYVRPFKFSGLLAWFVWLSVHLLWLIGYRNKFLVLIDWAWNYLFYEQGARTITTGGVPPPSRGGK